MEVSIIVHIKEEGITVGDLSAQVLEGSNGLGDWGVLIIGHIQLQNDDIRESGLDLRDHLSIMMCLISRAPSH